MTPLPRLADALGTAVRVRDVRVGTVTGVLGDRGFERVIGFEVTSRDGRRRFLPWVGAPVRDGSLSLGSALVLVETGELDAYRRLGAVVVRDPMQLDGLGIDSDGRVERFHDRRGVSPWTGSGTSAM